MKKMLSLLLALMLCFSVCTSALAAGSKSSTGTGAAAAEQGENSEAEDASISGSVIILYTGDVHGSIEGYAKVAAAKKTLEAEGAYVLLLDAGDYLQGSTAVDVSKGANAVELMELAGYDAATLGCSDFDFGFENLKAQMQNAEFQVLAANVTCDGETVFASSAVFESEDGVKIGVFGLTTPETADLAQSELPEDVSILGGEELYACAQEQADALADAGCDYIVCLAHLGIDEDSAAEGNRSLDLLENVTGIDILIDGHSHSTYEEVLEETDGSGMVGDTHLTSAGSALESLGMVVMMDGEIAIDTVPLAEMSGADEEIAARVREIQDELEADFQDVIDGAWYEEYVAYVYAYGLMKGVSDDMFDLTGEVNTQTLVTVLYRLAGEPDVEGSLSAYTDGDSVASWATDAMIWATQNGIVTGTGTALEPTAAASRQRVATILYRYFGSPAVEDADLSGYSDAGQIAAWARTAMEWANVNGVITGSADGTLNPTGGTTRAAMAKILTVISGLATK